MRALEAAHLAQTGASSLSLMERAAQAIARELAGLGVQTAFFVCGVGGNGGDALAAARLFAQSGGRSLVYAPAEARIAGDARVNLLRARETPGVRFVPLDDLKTADACVDGLLGIGLSRPVSGEASACVDALNDWGGAGRPLIAVDIPSGLSAQTGFPLGACVRASRTITFEAPKYGHFVGDALAYTGALTVAPLGIDPALYPPCVQEPTLSDALAALKPRPRVSHKGTFGHLLLIAGSLGYAGAAVLAARAALRSGTGLVTVACPEPIAQILQTAEPCAMVAALPARDAGAALQALLPGKTALAVGPGLGKAAEPGLIAAALSAGLPAVVDADALNALAAHPALRPLLGARHVLTPHPGEAARLLGRKVADPVADALALRMGGAVAVLKGAVSVICGDSTYLRTCGNAGLARGGSGDVLTGLIGALLAQGYAPTDAAWIGAELHGRLGERTCARLGERGMTAGDLISDLPGLFQSHEA